MFVRPLPAARVPINIELQWITWHALGGQSQNAVETYLGLLRYGDKEHVILHWVNDDGDISEGGRDDSPAVVPGVLRPDDVDLVIPQVTELQEQIGSWLIRVITAVYEGPGLTNWIIKLGGKKKMPLI